MQVWDDVLGAWIDDSSAVRVDGWQNPLTGYGTSRDKARAAHFHLTGWDELDFETCAGLLMKDDIAARIIEAPVLESFRKGYELAVEDEKTPELAAEFCTFAETLQVDEMVQSAWTWGRGLGGAILYVNANDGRDPSEPLDEKNIRSIDSLIVFDARYARPARYYANFKDPAQALVFGKPEAYWLTTGVQANTAAALPEVHESRCIRFGGSLTDVRTRWRRGSWDLSTLQRPYEKIKAFEQAFQATGNALADFSQGVFEIEGLLNVIASGQAENIGVRIAELDRNRSAARSVIIDKEKESFTNLARSFASIPEILDRFILYLAAAVPMPVSILMGRSAAGMNATGESDFQAWYDTVDSLRVKKATPPLQRLHRLLSLAKNGPTGGKGRKFDINWRPLKAMTDKERADLEYTTAQKDQIYITTAVLTPEEVAMSRFGGDEWSPETTIDVDARAAAQKDGESFEPYPNDPEPPPPPQTPPAKGEPNTGTSPGGPTAT